MGINPRRLSSTGIVMGVRRGRQNHCSSCGGLRSVITLSAHCTQHTQKQHTEKLTPPAPTWQQCLLVLTINLKIKRLGKRQYQTDPLPHHLLAAAAALCATQEF